MNVVTNDDFIRILCKLRNVQKMNDGPVPFSSTEREISPQLEI